MQYFIAIMGVVLLLLLVILFTSKRPQWISYHNNGFRDVILSIDSLEEHARDLAVNHKVTRDSRFLSPAFPNIEEDRRFLLQAYKAINEDVKSRQPLVPASEWLLDNFYVIEEQIKEIENNFSNKILAGLPVLLTGHYKGLPRVYWLAIEMIAHTEGIINDEVVTRFIRAFQSEVSLTSAELWSIPYMLRIGLIKNIRKIALHIVEAQEQRKSADKWSERFLDSIQRSQEELQKTIDEFDKSTGVMESAFVERLLQRLRDQGGEASPILRWLDEKLADQDMIAESVIQSEHHEQASNQVSIGNAITSLRFLSGLNWTDLFEELSQVEQILRQDPMGIYKTMDFVTRDHYRHKVEELAKEYKISEVQVVKKALECAQEVDSDPGPYEKYRHIGYYLIDKGREILDGKIGYKARGIKRVNAYFAQHPAFVYLGSIGIITLSMMGLFINYALEHMEYFHLGLISLVAVVIFIPALSIAIGVVNWIITHVCTPCYLPKLELRDGIPDEFRTMVVIPTLLTSAKRASELIEQMEVFYLANQEKNLYFALLGDFKDSHNPETDEDEHIINTAIQGIRELNERYGDEKGDIFFYYHRKRKWNAAQGTWMGWERKRGALMEFNRLLQGDKNADFLVKVGDQSVLSTIRYVITLDADTQLPRDAAKRLIGAMAHPLNRPVLNEEGTRVVEGYGILQPRIGITVTSASRSFFSLIFSGQTGLDPYTTAVSDIYQDLFCEGIFTGKGIYDVRTFLKVLDGKIPDNAVLSHDLLEGSYARTGLVSDIELVDGYPSQYNAYSMRLHRWVRGDWQLLPWLGKEIRSTAGELLENPLSSMAKWKIMDNQRRSLLSPAILLMLFLGFTVFPGNPVVWLSLGIITLAFPLISDMIGNLIVRFQNPRISGKLSEMIFETKNVVWQVIFTFIFLPYQAVLMMDAVIRTIYRVYVSKRKLLEWVTAADAEKSFKGELKDFWMKMWSSSVIAAAYFLIIPSHISFWPVIAGFSLLWFFAPTIAYSISKPYQNRMPALSQENIRELRILARKTWRYFEDFVTAKDNWLAPDNYQEDPKKGLAHRTSPTNIGFALMANLSAYDFGYLGLVEMLERVDATLRSTERLEKWHGHLYNWYDTLNSKPLHPLYISSVDSGNLAGYLMTLIQGIQEAIKRPLFTPAMLEGLRDTVYLAIEETGEAKEKQAGILEQIHNQIEKALLANEKNLLEWGVLLTEIAEMLEEYKQHHAFDKDSWCHKLHHMIAAYRRELDELAPWVFNFSGIPQELASRMHSMEEVSDTFNLLVQDLNEKASLYGLMEGYSGTLDKLSDVMAALLNMKKRERIHEEILEWLKELELSLAKSHISVKRRIQQAADLVGRLDAMVQNMDFSYLYDKKKELFAIGYDAEENKLSNAYYDLLASESRQTSFIAIAKGDVPQKHWFRLGRSLTLVGDRRVLLSWSGTMFEYLMPLLLMKNYEYTLLDETYNSIIVAQKQYGEQKHVPWGVSESGYYAFDLNLNYQYKAFGIPRIGLKRGLVRDTVIAPYASVLALQIAPLEALRNIEYLLQEGMGGTYGLYEAIDYTPDRIPNKSKSMIVKSYMVHHQGMSLLALSNCLMDNILQRRFHAIPAVRATELLLQERIPKRNILIKEYDESMPDMEVAKYQEVRANRSLSEANTVIPEVHVLSNGSYSVMVTNSGSGFSVCHGIALTRWREDVTQDNWGTYFYIHNLNSNEYWSATYQPVGRIPEEYHVSFDPDRAVFFRKDGNIETRTEISVSPENNAEVRRITLVNHSQHSRTVEVTSFFELVIAPQAVDMAHPAFSNLFVQTEYLPESHALIATRRPRTRDQKPLWVVHTVAMEGQEIGHTEYETDRARFIGRGRTVSNPLALEPECPLSNTTGAVLDPIMSLRKRVVIHAGETVRLSFAIAAAKSREEAVELAREYQSTTIASRVFELAWTHSQVELRYLNIRANQANLYQHMLSQILFLSPGRKSRSESIRQNHKGQSGLWSYGISGDLPIVLLKVNSLDHINLVRQVLTAHEYWRLKGLSIDLVILNEFENRYDQPLQERLRDIIAMSHARDMQDKPGGVFLRQSANIEEHDRILLMAAARIVLYGDKGTIADQIKVEMEKGDLPEPFMPSLPTYPAEDFRIPPMPKDIMFFNGLGGFLKNGKEYWIRLYENQNTPMPWVNIIANQQYGFLVTERGSGYTWAYNSRENKITPWSNDPIIDPAGEILYLRDEESGEVWTITPGPIRKKTVYTVRHGLGYSTFEVTYLGLEQSLTLFVDIREPVKLFHIRLKNNSGKTRTLSATLYVEFVLGVHRQQNAPYIVTGYDESSGALIAQNSFNEEFKDNMAFLYALSSDVAYTGDRTEFLGRNGTAACPAALQRKGLSGNTGAGYDPCGVLQFNIHMEADEEKTVDFILGCGKGIEHVRSLVEMFKDNASIEESLQRVADFWTEKTTVLQVNTPDPSMNIMLNQWLLYQTWVSRYWARTGFYQAGGAYGFRDQLQDVMSLVFSGPEVTKEQILRCAAHQFKEGDVQHWWHPPYRGVRTKITDDLLFLPYVTADYIEITGDWSILDIEEHYLETEHLRPDQEDLYIIPAVSEEVGTIYDHCIRAIEHALQFGEHGLPLMGTGDWNDGMNSVGDEGKGESVWLGWFLYCVLKRFIPICDARGDMEHVEKYSKIKDELINSIETHAWDGGWYRRAYFDDGRPLGSQENDECSIDSISQSWAVISGAARPGRISEAMLALENHLIRRDEGLIQLLAPAFDKSDIEPGYIKGYVPGVRENGGQYTHAAAWTVLAFAKLGNGEKAWELYNLLNPINHARTSIEVAKYKVEPYVMAADVYAVYPHTGRGGWTWYTGSAGWMYRVGIEWILGFKLSHGNKLAIEPCIPPHWQEYAIDYRFKTTKYQIKIENPQGVMSGVKEIIVDGRKQEDRFIELLDDGSQHEVKIIMG